MSALSFRAVTAGPSEHLVASSAASQEDYDTKVRKELYKNLVRLVKAELYSRDQELRHLHEDLEGLGVESTIVVIKRAHQIDNNSVPDRYRAYLVSCGFAVEDITLETVRAALEWFKGLPAREVMAVTPYMSRKSDIQ